MARIIKANLNASSGSPAGTVMSLTDFAEQVRSVVLEARKEAARITAEARAQADAACQAAAETGYAEGFARGQNDGYEDGHRRGLAEAKKEFAEQAAGLIELAERIVRELEHARAELLHRARCEMLDFALELAEKIVGRVATRDPAAARENLRKVLELSDCAREVCVRVNPSQMAALQEVLPKLAEALGRTGAVRLAADGGVSPGGVKLLSAAGEIDGTIETQLGNIVEVLLGRAAEDRDEPCCREAGAPPAGSAEAVRTGHYEPAAGDTADRAGGLEANIGTTDREQA